MKLPITLLLFMVLIQISCSVDQNEVTLDKMIGKWELISTFENFDDSTYKDVLDTSNFYHITISRKTNNTGLWFEEEYNQIDWVFLSYKEQPLEIIESGTKCRVGEFRLIGGGYHLDYDVTFDGQNLIMTYDDSFERIMTLIPIE